MEIKKLGTQTSISVASLTEKKNTHRRDDPPPSFVKLAIWESGGNRACCSFYTGDEKKES